MDRSALTDGAIHLLQKNPLVNVILVIGATLMVATLGRNIASDHDVEIFFPEHDEQTEYYRRFQELFDTDDNILVAALEADDVFAPRHLRNIDSLTRAVADMDGVVEVTSLTSVERLRGSSDSLIFEPWIREVNSDSATTARLKREMLAEPLIRGSLVSADARTTALVFEIDPDSAHYAFRKRIFSQLFPILKQFDYRFYVAGIPFIRNEYVDILNRERNRFALLVIALAIIILFITFRDLQGIVLPVATIILGTLWCVGIMGGGGITLNIMTNILPTLIVIVGVADSIHILLNYYEEVVAGRTRRESVATTIRRIGGATFMTSLTTAIGFGVLIVANVRPVREFGLVAALGILVTFVISIVLVPSLLMMWKRPLSGRANALGAGRWTHSFAAVHTFCLRRYRLVLLFTLGVVIVAGIGASRLRSNWGVLNDVKKGFRVHDDLRFIEQKLSGALSLELVIDSGRPDGITDPANLRAMELLSIFLEGIPEVSHPISIVNAVKATNRALNGGAQAFFRIPDDQGVIAEQLFLFSMSGGKGIDEFVDLDYQTARISARVDNVHSDRLKEILRQTDRFIAGEMPDGLDVRITGTMCVVNRLNQYIGVDLASSLLWAILLISGIMAFLFRSPGMVLVSLVPNLVPLACLAGVMGFAGIELMPSTATIFSISFGIAVDDTIHFLARFRQETAAGHDLPEAIRRTLAGTGKAIVVTTIILMAGFLVFMASDFSSTFNFGFLSCVTLATALLADLFLLPSLLLVMRPRLRS